MMLFSSENGPDEVRAGPMRQIPLDLGPTSVMGLDEFVQGRNAEALSWLRTWPEVDSLRYYYLGSNWFRRVEHVGAKPATDMNGPLII